jgi:hypothetical protein
LRTTCREVRDINPFFEAKADYPRNILLLQDKGLRFIRELYREIVFGYNNAACFNPFRKIPGIAADGGITGNRNVRGVYLLQGGSPGLPGEASLVQGKKEMEYGVTVRKRDHYQ